VRSNMLHGSETSPVRKENEVDTSSGIDENGLIIYSTCLLYRTLFATQAEEHKHNTQQYTDDKNDDK